MPVGKGLLPTKTPSLLDVRKSDKETIMKKRTRKIALLDRDGTLIFEPQDTKQVDSVEGIKLLPGVVRGLKLLQEEGFMLVMVSNQDGVGTPAFPLASFEAVQRKLLEILSKKGVVFDKVFICPHFEADNCLCRKPNIGLVKEFLSDIQVDERQSFMLGDRQSDEEFAENVGVRFIAAETNGVFPEIK